MTVSSDRDARVYDYSGNLITTKPYTPAILPMPPTTLFYGGLDCRYGLTLEPYAGHLWSFSVDSAGRTTSCNSFDVPPDELRHGVSSAAAGRFFGLVVRAGKVDVFGMDTSGLTPPAVVAQSPVLAVSAAGRYALAVVDARLQPPSAVYFKGSAQNLQLAWSAPAALDPLITGYRIEYAVDDGSAQTLVADTGNATTSFPLTGLAEGHRLYFLVSTLVGDNASLQASSGALILDQGRATRLVFGCVDTGDGSALPASRWASTDSTGYYTASGNVEPAEFWIQAPATDTALVTFTGGLTGRISIPPSQQGLCIRIPPVYRYTLMATDAEGAPVRNANVALVSPGWEASALEPAGLKYQGNLARAQRRADRLHWPLHDRDAGPRAYIVPVPAKTAQLRPGSSSRPSPRTGRRWAAVRSSSTTRPS